MIIEIEEEIGMENKLVTLADLELFKIALLSEIGKLLKGSSARPEKQWLKSREVRKMLGLSPGKLQTMRNSKTITYMKIGGVIYYDQDDINKMFDENKVVAKGR